MKKNLLIFAALIISMSLFPGISNAQFAKGTILVEGGLGNLTVANSKTRWEDNTGAVNSRYKDNGFSIGIFPRIGFFVTKDFVVGTTLGLNYSSNKSTDQNTVTSVNEYETKTSSFRLDFMPFARYYFGKNTGTRFYGQIGGGIGVDLSDKSEGKNLQTGTTSKYNYPKKPTTVSGEALVGLNHFISQNVAINAGLGYKYSSTKYTETYTNYLGITGTPDKYINTGGAFIWNVGFTMFIPCTKKGKK